jgi:toxin ParE1/3/4
MYQYILEPEAQVKYEEAFNWYSERSQKAALNFVESIEEALELICTQPYQHKNIYTNYHEINTKNFPFTLVYTIEEKIKTVVG